MHHLFKHQSKDHLPLLFCCEFFPLLSCYVSMLSVDRFILLMLRFASLGESSKCCALIHNGDEAVALLLSENKCKSLNTRIYPSRAWPDKALGQKYNDDLFLSVSSVCVCVCAAWNHISMLSCTASGQVRHRGRSDSNGFSSTLNLIVSHSLGSQFRSSSLEMALPVRGSGKARLWVSRSCNKYRRTQETKDRYKHSWVET